jgi:hypothetical protein
MSRPKVTYLERGRLRVHPSLTVQPEWQRAEDDTLPDALRELVQTWRGLYFDFAEPPRRDIIATLKRLVTASDEEIRVAVQILDPFTACQLELRGGYQLAGGAGGSLHADEWTPDFVRRAAKKALAHVPLATRPGTANKDLQLLAVLRRCWLAAGMPLPGERSKRTDAAGPPWRDLRRWINEQRLASFTAFAQNFFSHLGRPLSPGSIRGLNDKRRRTKG